MAKSKTVVKKGGNVGKQDKIGSVKKFKSKRASSPTGAVAGGQAKKIQKRQSDKKGPGKGKSELDNPKFANKDFMMEMIEKASGKEEQRQAAKLARREAVERKVKEKDDKKEKEKGVKQAKLDLMKFTDCHRFHGTVAAAVVVALGASASASILPNMIKVFTGEKQFCWDTTDMVFAYGDSYTNLMGSAGSVWTWNNFAAGKNSTLKGTIQLNGTTAHGPNWIQYLTNCYQGLPQNCRPQLFDVAFGGSTVDRSLVAPAYDFIKDLDQQISNWDQYVRPKVEWSPDTTLTVLWFGINDVTRAVKDTDGTNGTNSTKSTNDAKSNLKLGILFNKILDRYFEHLDTLHKKYQMRFFLINNVPPMDRTPSGRADADRLGPLVNAFNDLLLGRIAYYSTLNPDVTLVHFDAHKYFGYYLDHYKEYGFKDIENSCDKKVCKYPQYEYFWMNGAHPMYPVHKLLGEDITAQLRNKQQCPSPSS
ncbi:hypothetical protein BDB00DRAFT_929458 [Zychaea mexicana]|uniref:uncharacterized protein n=1 Tax=Zychaea mexicana TaxID=64656 RepID=UPI0022FE4953|nr:uncharacterized protein BDB00DRAFT_929458 [Zychaea mexicana]KAI9492836.1 hypothetical protein BDB00DRAFT_929458 [Zychaea mexicana]